MVTLPDYDADSDTAADPADQAAFDAWRAYQRSTSEALSRSADPRDWALAAVVGVLSFDAVENSAATKAQLARAVSASGDDILVQWIGARMLADAKPTGRTNPAARRLQHLEPENAAAWLDELVAAVQRKDNAAIDATLARMSSAVRFDLHYADLMQAAADVYRRYPLPSEIAAQVGAEFPPESLPYTMAMSVAATTAMPPFQDFVNACRAPKGQTSVRAADCAAIGRLMVNHSDALIGNRFGYTLLRVSRTYTDEDLRAARTDDWVYSKFTDTAMNVDAQTGNALFTFQKEWMHTGSELEAMRRSLAVHGIAPTPPDDWADDLSLFSAERLHADEVRLDQTAPVK